MISKVNFYYRNYWQKNVYIDVTDENWFGVTYKQDSDNVKEKIKKLVETGSYPSSLWNK